MGSRKQGKKWRAEKSIDGVKYHLGMFRTKTEADNAVEQVSLWGIKQYRSNLAATDFELRTKHLMSNHIKTGSKKTTMQEQSVLGKIMDKISGILKRKF